MIGVDLRNLLAKLYLPLKKFLDTIVTSFTIIRSVMLTALKISYACSYLMHLTAMMSYDACKRIQILCVHNSTRMRKLRISSVFKLRYTHDIMAVA